jgi:hypothetical protein
VTAVLDFLPTWAFEAFGLLGFISTLVTLAIALVLAVAETRERLRSRGPRVTVRRPDGEGEVVDLHDWARRHAS